MDREVSVPIKLKASVQQGRVNTDLVAIIEVVRNPLTFGMPTLFMWTNVPCLFFTSSRKKSQYLRPCCLHRPLQLLTGRLAWSIWYTIKTSERICWIELICFAHVVTRITRPFQRARHWPDRDYDSLGSLPGDQYGLIKKATAVSIINLLVNNLLINEQLITLLSI